MAYGKNQGNSESAVELISQARKLIQQKRRQDGLQLYRELTIRYPSYAEGWFERSGIENGLGNTLTAIEVGKRALELASGNALYRAHLAQLQVNYGLWGDALDTLAPLLDRPPASYEARITNGIGAVLSLSGLEREAQPWFEVAARAAPGQRNYLFNFAQGLVHCGELAAAEPAFQRLLRAFPDFAKAHWSLASLSAKQSNWERVETLRNALARAESPSDEVYYCFSLFILLDAMGHTREAFSELEHGMKLQRALIRYAGEDVSALRRLAKLGEELLAASDPPDRVEPGQPRPIFIVGLPRSGTTLVERILSNHPDVAQGGEFICFSAALRERLGVEPPGIVPPQLVERLASNRDLTGIGQRYLQLTAFKRDGRDFFTDKLPFNFMLLPWIAQALPNARFVHVRRDPMDTCFSNLKQLFSRHYAACYSQLDIGEYYGAYYELMQTWDRLLPGRILQVRYESLVADPESESNRILDFCGLNRSPGAWQIENNAKPVATASAIQVRDPINARSIGAWLRYKEQLKPLSDFFGRHPQLLS